MRSRDGSEKLEEKVRYTWITGRGGVPAERRGWTICGALIRWGVVLRSYGGIRHNRTSVMSRPPSGSTSDCRHVNLPDGSVYANDQTWINAVGDAVGVAGFRLCYSVFDGMKVDNDVSTATFLIDDYDRR